MGFCHRLAAADNCVFFPILLCKNAVIVLSNAIWKQVCRCLGPNTLFSICGWHENLSGIGRAPANDDSSETSFDGGWHLGVPGARCYVEIVLGSLESQVRQYCKRVRE